MQDNKPWPEGNEVIYDPFASELPTIHASVWPNRKPSTITHLAGPVVVLAGRAIQRCAVCGQKLADSKGQMGPVGANGEPPQFLEWPEKAMVQVTAGNPSHYLVTGSLNDDKDLPDDFCEQWE